MVHHVASTYGYTLQVISQMTRPQLRLLSRGAAEIGRIHKEVHEEMMAEYRAERKGRRGLGVSRGGSGKDNANINPGNVLQLLTMPGFKATPRLEAYLKKKAAQKRTAEEKGKTVN